MKAWLLGAALVCAATTGARAQVVTYTPGFDPDRFVLTADPTSIGLTDGARPMKKLEFALGMALRVGAAPLQICVKDGTNGTCAQSGDLVSPQFKSDLVGTLGLGRIGLSAQLPVILYQGSDFDADNAKLDVAGTGDLRLGVKFLLAELGAAKEHAVAIDARGLVPTGSGDFSGDKGTSIEGRVIYELRPGAFGFDAQVGYAWKQKGSQIANLYVDDEVLWSVAAEYRVKPAVAVGLAAFGRIGLMKNPTSMEAPGPEERPGELMASTRWWATKSVAVEAGAGTAIHEGYGALEFRALAGVRYQQRTPDAPPDLDWDHDGIPNATDQCPHVGEDFDGFADEDGCPEPDNDKDGLVDSVDKCPNDPEDFDKFEDDDGCPELDNDKDLILDAVDNCPLDPEDKDAFEDEDGCPDPDNDKDGILDGVDRCPLEPEDVDGFEDTDGCPDTDNDKDGLLDQVDKCPNEAETYNGIDDADGCPDAAPTVIVTATKVEIKETIYFDFDKATIKPVSFQLLDGVAAALAAHAKLDIRVEGHTDDQGNDDYNLRLSQARSESVRAYLIKKGIDPTRLVAVGFGETRPAVPGKTKAARDKNRRVEFVITNNPQPSATGGIPAAPSQPGTPVPTPGTPVTAPTP